MCRQYIRLIVTSLVTTFKREFLDEIISIYYIKEYIGYSGYDGEDYATFIDETGDTFLVQLSRNMVIKYDRNVVSERDILKSKAAVEKYFNLRKYGTID